MFRVIILGSIDAHGLKIQGRGYLKFLLKSLGGSWLSGNTAIEGLPISGFISFLLTSVLKFAFKCHIFTLPLPPSPSPVWIYEW
jgi:hypothetical protein